MYIKKREHSIDILRAIGLFLIFLSHAQPESNIIMQLRCFDVPLMVFISGLVSSGKIINDYKQFILKRATRLVAPVWIFLSFYFLVVGIFQELKWIPEYLTCHKIIESYLLLNGIGYVWIIRVFLLIMFITPFLCKIAKIKNIVYIFFIIIFCLLCTDAFTLFASRIDFPSIKFIINNYLIYILGYSTLFILGVRLRFNQIKEVKKIILFVLFLFIIAFSFYFYTHGNHYTITPDYKYPPRTYYLVYGIFISVILWISKKHWIHIFDCKLFRFIGENTIWIYLWHIPFALLSTRCDNFFFRYIILSCFPIAIFYIQYTFIKKLSVSDKIKNLFIG